MSNRTERRAAERAILEAARRAAYVNPPSFARRMDPKGVMSGPHPNSKGELKAKSLRQRLGGRVAKSSPLVRTLIEPSG
jgi:hypothetical protein